MLSFVSPLPELTIGNGGQVPGGLDPYRAPEYAEDPDGLLAWFQEPFPASHCDRHVVDPAWMGPGEYAYHLSPNRCWCSRE